MIDTNGVLAISAIVGSVATAIKQVIDKKQIEKWRCFKNPCPDRETGEPGVK